MIRALFAGSIGIGLVVALSATPVLAACGAELAEFRSVIDSDAQTGNVNKSVYNRMLPEVARLTQLCQAGREADAVRGLHALKGRYGYH